MIVDNMILVITCIIISLFLLVGSYRLQDSRVFKAYKSWAFFLSLLVLLLESVGLLAMYYYNIQAIDLLIFPIFIILCSILVIYSTMYFFMLFSTTDSRLKQQKEESYIFLVNQSVVLLTVFAIAYSALFFTTLFE